MYPGTLVANSVMTPISTEWQLRPVSSAWRGRTEARSCGSGVAQAVISQPLEGRHVDGAAKCAGRAEAHVVDQDDEQLSAPAGGRTGSMAG